MVMEACGQERDGGTHHLSAAAYGLGQQAVTRKPRLRRQALEVFSHTVKVFFDRLIDKLDEVFYSLCHPVIPIPTGPWTPRSG